jgi:hypothetical protein
MGEPGIRVGMQRSANTGGTLLGAGANQRGTAGRRNFTEGA